jgi:hypothetical protein
MALKHFVEPEISDILIWIDKEKEKIHYAVCDFYCSLYEQIEWTNYDARVVIANGVLENRDSLLRIIDKQLAYLSCKVRHIPTIREEIVKFANERLDIKNDDQSDAASEE